MLEKDNVKRALDTFGTDVVKQARMNFRHKDVSGRGSRSIAYDLEIHPNSFMLAFEMENYMEFQDKGVKGVGGRKADGTIWKRKRVLPDSPYKYTNLKPPVRVFSRWLIRRGIAPRTSGGQFQKRRGLQFALATSVFHTGIETSLFFTRPFNKEFGQLPSELVEAYGLDVERFLKSTT